MMSGATPDRSGARTNLPLALTSFVGRQAELEMVKQLLSESRLVTLTGAGGIGKTRLAVEVAAEVAAGYRDGAWLVELAPLTNPEMVPWGVMRSLGLGERPGSTAMESLAESLIPLETLLVLDNCEHLVEACARLADGLLRRCPQLHILATSREVLRLTGETNWRVPSMTTMSDAHPASLEVLQRLETVQLFVQRADAARPGFRLTNENARSVGRICHRLDGIPLAIELAAARTRLMSVATIDGHLDRRFQLLTTGSRVSLPRQRTLEATLDWSHGLLTEEERRLFRRLSVFRGGFSLDAAEAVCADVEPEVSGDAILDSLSSLVDKSLVISEEGTDLTSRYGLLETVREYAYARLEDTGEAATLHQRHAEHYGMVGRQAAQGLRSPLQAAWFARIDDDLDNLRECLEWTLAHGSREALRLAVAMERYWVADARADGRRWLARCLDAAPERDVLRAYGLYVASQLASFGGAIEEGRQLGQECLALAREVGSDLFIGQAMSALAINVAVERAPGWEIENRTLFEEGEPYIRTANDPEALRRFLNNRGYCLHATGASAAARPMVEESLAVARRLGDAWGLHITLGSLAEIEQALGETQSAMAHLREELEIAGRIRSRSGTADALSQLADIALLNDDPVRCLRLLSGAVELERQLSPVTAIISPQSLRLHAEARDVARRQVGDEIADAAWHEGAGMDLDDLVRYGLGGGAETEVSTAAALPQPAASSRGGANVFLREGAFWTLSFAGRLVRLKDSKGLRDIWRLIAEAGRELAAVDLAGSMLPPPPGVVAAAEAGWGLEGDAGPILDREARQQYRERLTDVETEINDGEAANDPERVALARREREFLLAELSAAVGLGGRERHALDPAERARKAVTERIRGAIGHIAAEHAELGDHLRRSIRTGAFCVYDPPQPTAWRLSVPRDG
jgi:predicted ATPase